MYGDAQEGPESVAERPARVDRTTSVRKPPLGFRSDERAVFTVRRGRSWMAFRYTIVSLEQAVEDTPACFVRRPAGRSFRDGRSAQSGLLAVVLQ